MEIMMGMAMFSSRLFTGITPILFSLLGLSDKFILLRPFSLFF